MPKKKSQKRLHVFFYLILVYCLATQPVHAQSLSNLDVMYRLADSAAAGMVNRLPADSKSVYLKTSLPNSYPIFENRIISLIRGSEKSVLTIPDSLNVPAVNFTIDNARVNYPEMFRDGIFGGYRVKRVVILQGSYIISEKGLVVDSHNFNYIKEDTVLQSDVKELENPSLPFTRGDLPPEPLFSTILEPVVALGTAAAVIYLFFSIRSK